MLTKGEFEMRKERINQVINQVEIDKIEKQLIIKKNESKVLDFTIKNSEIAIEQSKVSLDSARLGLESSKIAVVSLKDKFSYDKAKLTLNRQLLGVDLESTALNLSKKKSELKENSELFKIQHKTLTEIKFNLESSKTYES